MTAPNNLAHMAYDAFVMASRMNMPPYASIGPAQMHWIAVALVVADTERERIIAALRDRADRYDAEFARPGEVTETASGYRRSADLIERGEL